MPRFYRPYKRIPAASTASAAVTTPPTSATSNNNAAASSSSTGNTGNSSTGGTINNLTSTLFRPFSAANRQQSTAASNSVSEEEKAARREAMSKAAADRSQAWDKRVSAGSKRQPLQSTTPAAAREDNDASASAVHDEERQKLIQKIKDEEARIANQLGYSPFKPHMSFSGNGTVPIGTANNNTTQNAPIPVTGTVLSSINNVNLIPSTTPAASLYGPALPPVSTMTPGKSTLLLRLDTSIKLTFVS